MSTALHTCGWLFDELRLSMPDSHYLAGLAVPDHSDTIYSVVITPCANPISESPSCSDRIFHNRWRYTPVLHLVESVARVRNLVNSCWLVPHRLQIFQLKSSPP